MWVPTMCKSSVIHDGKVTESDLQVTQDIYRKHFSIIRIIIMISDQVLASYNKFKLYNNSTQNIQRLIQTS